MKPLLTPCKSPEHRMVRDPRSRKRHHPAGERAKHPFARLVRRRAALPRLLNLAGAAPASSSCLASGPAGRTFGRVQQRLPG